MDQVEGQGSANSAQVVQPDADNEIEKALAFSAQEALTGGSVFSSHAAAQADVIRSLEKGRLAETRPDFRESLMRIFVPQLEQATFDPKYFQTNPDHLRKYLAQMAEENARSLAQAFRAAAQQLADSQ